MIASLSDVIEVLPRFMAEQRQLHAYRRGELHTVPAPVKCPSCGQDLTETAELHKKKRRR